MTLDTTLREQFKKFSPKPIHYTANLAHLFADYVEILAVLQNGDWISSADLVKRYKDVGVSVPKVSQICAGELQSEEATPAEIEDTYDAWAQQVYSQLTERTTLFSDDYAFDCEGESLRLKENLTNRQKIYLMLVLCSNLHFVPKLQDTLTKEFETLSAEVLRNILPKNAIIKQFGKGTEYTGTAQDKIWKLALDMNLEINEREVRKVLGNQERGLDVVGWIPFKDKYANFVAMLVQCACGKNWYSKLSETRRYESSYFFFEKISPIHALMVPRCLHYRGDLYQSDELHDVLLFERCRIMELLESEDFFQALDSKSIVEWLVDLEEDLV